MKKAQGATEYLIILAVVIIIALIVVAAMGGIPGIGTAANERASASFWQTAEMAIPNYALSANTDTLTLDLRNNKRSTVSLSTVDIAGTTANCEQNSLAAGQTTNCTVSLSDDYVQGDSFTLDVSIQYTDVATGAVYTYTGEGHDLIGKAAQ